MESGKTKPVLRLEGSCLGFNSLGQNMTGHLNEETKCVFPVLITVNGYEKCILCGCTPQYLYHVVHSSAVIGPKELGGFYGY